MADIVNIGIIGAGRIGRVHASHLVHRLPGANVLMVADIAEEAARDLAGSLGIAAFGNEHRAVIERPDIEAVLICSSTDTHAALITEAARAGKHIFCEKPIAHSLNEIDAALEAVTRSGVKLQVGFNRRFDANFHRIRQAVEHGEVGEPALLHIISRDPGPPPLSYIAVSGGMFLDMTIHDFDMARYLIGSEVEEVYVQAGVTVDPAIGAAGDVDTAVTMLRFANGVIGTIDNCRRASYGYDQRVEVFGSKGAVHTENNYPNAIVLSDGQSVRRDLPLNFFMDRYTEAFVAELTAFINAIREDEPVPVTGFDGRQAVVIGLAAGQSYREQRPVRVDNGR
jgi:myo-inositol 2-dehydrogenase/D-chiro-inositol 1-dehydrogenase